MIEIFNGPYYKWIKSFNPINDIRFTIHQIQVFLQCFTFKWFGRKT